MYKRLLVTVLLFAAPALAEYVPTGGWDYLYDGDVLIVGPGTDFDSLDGTWHHQNSSDEWDGSEIGAGSPGGISALTDGDTTFLRIQDTGDPRDYGFSDPGSIRKIYLTHLADEVAEPGGILNSGNFVMAFRARIATGAPLDDMHPDGGGGIEPWPVDGKGAHNSDRGKGMFTIGQGDAYRGGSGSAWGEQVSFSICWVDDERGLFMTNNLNGNVVGWDSANQADFRDTGEGYVNAMVFQNPTDWHTFLVGVEPDVTGVGTHKVTMTIDPDDMGVGLTREFIVTAGMDIQVPDGGNHIATGIGNTTQWGAYDLDWIAYQIPEPATIALLGLGGLALLRRKR